MVRFAICNEMFQGWEIEKVFKFASEVGYSGVEIAPFALAEDVRTITKAQRRQIRASAEVAGVEVVGLHWLLVKPEGLHIHHPDESVRQRTEDYLRALIEFCADIGGRIMVFGSPRQRKFLEGESQDEAWERAIRTFLNIMPDAERNKVTICIEPLSPEETDFINTVTEAIRLVEAISHPNFQLMVDVKAMLSEGRPLDQIILEAAPYLKHVHANDANRLGPGMGETDYKPIVNALRKIGYDGFVSVEAFDFTPGAETIARSSIVYLREVFLGQ
ncbi:MAG: sugar phosphate isomerase/epimerase family protein [Armatimonadota bacterium]|nr:sugar phosphate isomerase/epimerase [Armatimonadota bacterium]MCX7777023.1 sugar phosphate isomerase/epimerase [Armatimonadota bacterium]MDW8024909.1 sugar phosphate isomerase/epimerase family protein [Armatimonadota bacterium]